MTPLASDQLTGKCVSLFNRLLTRSLLPLPIKGTVVNLYSEISFAPSVFASRLVPQLRPKKVLMCPANRSPQVAHLRITVADRDGFIATSVPYSATPQWAHGARSIE
jgi:hypothetical protein